MYSLSNISLGIQIYKLEKMIEENDVYDFAGNNVKEQMEAEVERLQKIYNEEEKGEELI